MENVSKSNDVTLVAGLDGEKFPVQRNKLSATGPYFRALLGPDYKEANDNQVQIRDIDGPTLKAIIDFCYTGHTEITADNVVDLINAASSMELLLLEKLCSDFLSKNLNNSNCLSVLLLANTFAQLTDLQQAAMRYICSHFSKIPITDMVELDEKLFGTILKHDEIATAESTIFDTFVEWTQHDKEHRSSCVAGLAQYIRLMHIPGEVLVRAVEPFFEEHGCLQLVMTEYRKRSHEPVIFPLRFSSKTSKLCAVEWNNRSDEVIVHEFDESQKWTVLKTFSYSTGPTRGGRVFIFASGNLYVIASGTAGTKMCSYNLKTGDLEHLPDPPFTRPDSSNSSVVIGKYIYVIAKDDRNSTVYRSIWPWQRFDIEARLWETRAQIPLYGFHGNVVEMNGLIYMASIDQNNGCNRFWCYDPEEDAWTEKMRFVGSQTIFKAGGRLCTIFAGTNLKRYDPALDSWTLMETHSNWKESFILLSSIEFRGITYAYLYDVGDVQVFRFGIIDKAHFIDINKLERDHRILTKFFVTE